MAWYYRSGTSDKDIEKINELYRSDEFVSKISMAAAEIEGTLQGHLTLMKEPCCFK